MQPYPEEERIWFCFRCRKWLEESHVFLSKFKREHAACKGAVVDYSDDGKPFYGDGLVSTDVRGIIWMVKVQMGYQRSYSDIEVLGMLAREGGDGSA